MNLLTRAISALACSAVVTCLAGCTFNGSPIHTGLSDDEIAKRVRSRFTLGMTGPKVESQLRRQGLKFKIEPIPPRNDEREHDRGIKSYIYSAGFRYTGPYGEYSSETLYLWFSLDDRLEQIGYERVDWAELPEDATRALRIISRREEDTP